MDIKIFREYRLKFYLNARHFIIIGNQKGETHPHTWEFALTILIRRKEFVEFNIFEKSINEYLEKYQDRVLNDVEPFDSVLPTLENMVEIFTKDFDKDIEAIGGKLICVEGSEGPSRSYIIDLRHQNENVEVIEPKIDNILSEVMDTVLDEIID